MAALQTQFDQFHSSIKLGEDDEKANLRTKRDTLIKALAARLPDDVAEFDTFHQGSYSMHTGVRPLDGNYDIDIGVIFDCTRDAYADPVQLKKKIRDALDTHGRTVNIRRPCVTVNYMRDGEVDYHIDLAIYTKRADGLLDLAKGKEHSAAEHRVWEASDPKYLTELICTRFEGAELKQYRRCIRYMKRWRQVRFSSAGPISIALTVAAYLWFKPYQTTGGTVIDIVAMLDWTNAMLGRFSYTLTDEGFYPRLTVELPTTPYAELMQGMSKIQMETFKAELELLRDTLQAAYDETLPEEAAKKLVKVFGADFPVPNKSSTAKEVGAAFIGTGNSA
ncbi:nucleotidyltransferase domain-containing protein [Massilia oculi]|uniref:nucleotidyltransferase domain-containing protein n=1 Tax=Massilia oculi TaxID=945844 RepID=UPI0028B0E139|nr:nucleotidyltransferase [Massilia oculi]